MASHCRLAPDPVLVADQIAEIVNAADDPVVPGRSYTATAPTTSPDDVCFYVTVTEPNGIEHRYRVGIREEW